MVKPIDQTYLAITGADESSIYLATGKSVCAYQTEYWFPCNRLLNAEMDTLDLVKLGPHYVRIANYFRMFIAHLDGISLIIYNL